MNSQGLPTLTENQFVLLHDTMQGNAYIKMVFFDFGQVNLFNQAFVQGTA